MKKENNFKWMVYALLFLILYYVSKESVYIWFSGFSAFMYGIGLSAAIIDVIKYIKRKKKIIMTTEEKVKAYDNVREAPEKIYCVATDGGFYLTTIKPEPPFAEGVEYTRTDAFIDKAISWLKEQNEMIGVSFQKDFLERFQNYMKGG